MLVTSITFVAGWILGAVALQRRLGSLRTGETLRSLAPIAGAAVVAGVIGRLVVAVTDDLLGTSAAGSLGLVVIGTVVIGGVALAGLVLARVPEVREPLAAVRARTGRG
jgi:putative peptidoglycan lipid II flippase